MIKRIIGFMVVSSLVLCICGCDGQVSAGNNPDNTDLPTENTETKPSIFDNIIAGEPINEIESLYDFTGLLQRKDFSLITVCPLGENELLAVYSGNAASMIASYNVSNAEEEFKLEIEDTIISKDAVVNSVNNEFAYVVDITNKNIIYFDLRDKSYELIKMENIPDSIVIMDEGEQFFYTIEDDCNVYQYTKVTGNKISVFDASDMVEDIEVKYVVAGSNTLIVQVDSDNYSGYASLSLELQELSPLEEMTGELLYSGNEYIYTSPEKEATIIIYNPMTPRLFKEFCLDSTDEINNIKLFKDTPYIISQVESDTETVLRFYNIDKGIMENILELDASCKISNVEFYSNTNNIMLELDDSEEGCKIMIWNTEIIDKIIE